MSENVPSASRKELDQPAHFTVLDAFWTAKDAKFLHAENEDWSDCMDLCGWI